MAKGKGGSHTPALTIMGKLGSKIMTEC